MLILKVSYWDLLQHNVVDFNSFSHEFGFCARSAFFQQLSCTHASFCPNRHTPFVPRMRAVAIFLSVVLQTYRQPLCLPFIMLRHL